MNFIDAIKSGFQKYVVFSGRSARSEYWFWVLFTFLAGLILGFIDAMLFMSVDPTTGQPVGMQPLGMIFNLAVLLPSIAVGVRRLHDLDKSGWWLLINLIPIVGWIIFIVWAATKGTEGPNRFGAPVVA